MEVDKEPAKETTTKEKEPIKTVTEIDAITFEDIKEQCRLIERGEGMKETRQINRVLRSLVTIRRKINNNVMWRLINFYYIGSAAAEQKKELLDFLKSPDETTNTPASKLPWSQKRTAASSIGISALLPEVESYLHLLLVLFLMSEDRFRDAEKCMKTLLKQLESKNRRSLDPIAAKAYYFYAVVCEKLDILPSIVEYFQARLRMATLRHDEDSVATLINCLLRTYINANAYSMASHLIQRVTFPASASTNAWARFHYYNGRILAIQLQYTEAMGILQLALRKAPQNTAVGFRQSAQKLLVVVELLLGIIPERSLFRQAIYRKSLGPYYQLTQAVRSGDLQKFNLALSQHHPQFVQDGTLSLVVRLRQSVIRAAVRRISVAYSCISMRDVQRKLQLSRPDEAKFILAKAIKEGVCDAELKEDGGDGALKSKEAGELYSSDEPQFEFNRRIAFCLDLYNQAVKALRFPQKSTYADDMESLNEKREREQQELDLAKEMADDDEGDFD